MHLFVLWKEGSFSPPPFAAVIYEPLLLEEILAYKHFRLLLNNLPIVLYTLPPQIPDPQNALVMDEMSEARWWIGRSNRATLINRDSAKVAELISVVEEAPDSRNRRHSSQSRSGSPPPKRSRAAADE